MSRPVSPPVQERQGHAPELRGLEDREPMLAEAPAPEHLAERVLDHGGLIRPPIVLNAGHDRGETGPQGVNVTGRGHPSKLFLARALGVCGQAGEGYACGHVGEG